jgi:urease accessory protein
MTPKSHRSHLPAVEPLLRATVQAALLLSAASALAHSGGHDEVAGFLSGFLHPLLGLDHLVAMVAVGLWGAFLGAPAVWVLPVVFPLVMAFGGALGVAGVPLPGVELGIAASAIVLGAMVAAAARPPLAVAAVIVGLFAIFHGHAHGTELPDAGNALTYSLGFVLSTGLLHVSGIVFGLLVRWPAGRIAVRAVGGLIGAAGLVFLVGALR